MRVSSFLGNASSRVVVPVATVAVLASLLAAAQAPVAAAGETCSGLPATLVGAPGQDLVGTEGDDVIVTNGAATVSALGGSDTICVTGSTPRVDAGTGDDKVDSATTSRQLRTSLGAGSDSFTGNGSDDYVYVGDDDDDADGPLGTDIVSTGTGDDLVFVGAARGDDRPNNDAVSLGRGRDGVTVRGSMPHVDGGGGYDSIVPVWSRSSALDINVSTGTITRDSVSTGSISNLEAYHVNRIDWDGFRFTGGPAAEALWLGGGEGLTRGDGGVSARMGGGDDLLNVRSRDVGTFLGGGGQDTLAVFGKKTSTKSTSFFANMARSRFGFNGQRTATFRAFEDLTVRDVKHAVVKGNGRRNQIFVTGCNNTVFAKGGRDFVSGALFRACENARARAYTVYGMGGNDTLVGTFGRDVLIGGPGRDKALGRDNVDQCRAEVRRSCERR
ncbi:hypothetical protein GCM10027020_37900 [Nocardioides salsibiostraticola]